MYEWSGAADFVADYLNYVPIVPEHELVCFSHLFTPGFGGCHCGRLMMHPHSHDNNIDHYNYCSRSIKFYWNIGTTYIYCHLYPVTSTGFSDIRIPEPFPEVFDLLL